MELSEPREAIPVAIIVVLCGLRGAIEPANRLAALLRPGAALDPGGRR